MGKLLRQLKKAPKKLIYGGNHHKKSSTGVELDDSNSNSSSSESSSSPVDKSEYAALVENEDCNFTPISNGFELDEVEKRDNLLLLREENVVGFVVGPIELFLRKMSLLLVVFVLGAMVGSNYGYVFPFVRKVLECTVTAWITCLFIKWKAQQKRRRFVKLGSDKKLVKQGKVHSRDVGAMKEETEERRAVEQMKAANLVSEPNRIDSQPRSLEGLYLINMDNMQRIYPNSEPIELDNEYFSGKMLFMIRTPDDDDDGNQDDDSSNELGRKIAVYFRGKQRYFEFQFQIKLKKLPPDGSPLYIGCEIDNAVKLGSIQRIFVNAALSFVKKLNKGFHYSLEGGDEQGNSPPNATSVDSDRYEKPHISFDMQASMDRLVVTKATDCLPKLGDAIYEHPDSIKARKQGEKGDFAGWNLDDTYTMGLWSAYVDFLKWKCINFPGTRPFSFSTVVGLQPLYITLYYLQNAEDPSQHLRCNMRRLTDFEFSNVIASKGVCAHNWEAMVQQQPLDEHENALIPSNSNDDAENDNFDDEINDEDSIEDKEEVERVEELGEGMYLRSGDPILLREAKSAAMCSSASTSMDGDNDECYVTDGAGFAVLQSSASSTISLIKTSRMSKRRQSNNGHFLRSGDTVLVKMICRNGTETYLSTHRGTWLKWVHHIPKRNGCFHIITLETKGNLQIEGRSSSFRMQSTYLAIGGEFMLRHHRWSRYRIGASAMSSATFGGRMLGLYKPTHIYYDETIQPFVMCAVASVNTSTNHSDLKSSPPTANSTNDIDVAGNDKESLSVSPSQDIQLTRLDSTAWVEMMHRTKRVRQRAYIVRVQNNYSNQDSKAVEVDTQMASFTSAVSANTSDKCSSLSSQHEPPRLEPATSNNDSNCNFIRLRTVRELTPIVRLEQHLNRSTVPSTHSVKTKKILRRRVSVSNLRKKSTGERDLFSDKLEDVELPLSDGDIDTINATNSNVATSPEPIRRRVTDSNVVIPSKLPIQPIRRRAISADDGDGFDLQPSPSQSDDSELEEDVEDIILFPQLMDGAESLEDESSTTDEDENVVAQEPSPAISTYASPASPVVNTTQARVLVPLNYKKKHKKWMYRHGIGFVAKSAKGGTITVGKVSKKVTKTTVNAISKGFNPRRNRSWEPKRKIHKTGSTYRLEMQQLRNPKSKETTRVLAGQLSASDQSLRILSELLSEMVVLQHSSDKISLQFQKLFTSNILPPSELDSSFLRGGAYELGIVTTKYDEERTVHGCIVARCLWESHWREEWCVICRSHLSFYAPLSKKTSFTLSFDGLRSVRKLDPHVADNPLPGLSFLVVEAFWRCHYLAFDTTSTRDIFLSSLNEAIFAYNSIKRENKTKDKSIGGTTSVWERFVTSKEATLEGNIGKWALISSSNKSKHRMILNDRRMPFDIELKSDFSDTNAETSKSNVERKIGDFVEKMLAQALSLSSQDAIDDSNRDFVNFLDTTCQLRIIPLHCIDLTGKEAFCIFVNIFHCLLQHALLVTVPLHGPLNKRSIGHFMRCSCYEIGGDVFSLAELECRVLRGNMRPSVQLKPPFVEAPKKSKFYLDYALDFSDPKINFTINNAMLPSNPQSIPIYSPLNLEKQMFYSCRCLLRSQLSIDSKKRIIVLPKVCEIYRDDFGKGDSVSCLLFCLQFLDETSQSVIIDLISDDAGTPTIKYQHSSDSFYPCLKRDMAVL